jgi:hypothetical protein
MYYFTFGSKYDYEPHPVLGNISADEVVLVEADSYEEARTAMLDVVGTEFAFQYETSTIPDRVLLKITVKNENGKKIYSYIPFPSTPIVINRYAQIENAFVHTWPGKYQESLKDAK